MGEREYLLPQRDFVEVIKTLADEYIPPARLEAVVIS